MWLIENSFNVLNGNFQPLYREKTGQPKSICWIQMRARGSTHYFRATLDQFILLPLALLEIFFCRHRQTAPVSSLHLHRSILHKLHILSFYFIIINIIFSVRLWCTKLNSNLVCYKGHNYPVWDVQVRDQNWSC